MGTLARITDATGEATDAKCRMQVSRKKAIIITHSGVNDEAVGFHHGEAFTVEVFLQNLVLSISTF